MEMPTGNFILITSGSFALGAIFTVLLLRFFGTPGASSDKYKSKRKEVAEGLRNIANLLRGTSDSLYLKNMHNAVQDVASAYNRLEHLADSIELDGYIDSKEVNKIKGYLNRAKDKIRPLAPFERGEVSAARKILDDILEEYGLKE